MVQCHLEPMFCAHSYQVAAVHDGKLHAHVHHAYSQTAKKSEIRYPQVVWDLTDYIGVVLGLQGIHLNPPFFGARFTS